MSKHTIPTTQALQRWHQALELFELSMAMWKSNPKTVAQSGRRIQEFLMPPAGRLAASSLRWNIPT
jgi:hypothetical protein